MNPSLNLFQSIGGALLVLVILAVVGWVAITRIRAWMRQPEDTDEGFTLADLRRLHREGALTDEEFERAQAQIIAAVRRPSTPKGAPLAKHPPTAAPREPAKPLGPKRPSHTPPDPSPEDRVDFGLETPRPPSVESDAAGRIVIRDEGGNDAHHAPQSPTRPKLPTDPRTGRADA